MKKLLALILCLVLALTAVGCGSKPADTPTEAPAAPVEETPEEAPAAANVKTPMTGEAFTELMKSLGYDTNHPQETTITPDDESIAPLTATKYHAMAEFREGETLFGTIRATYYTHESDAYGDYVFAQNLKIAQEFEQTETDTLELLQGDNWLFLSARFEGAGALAVSRQTIMIVDNTIMMVEFSGGEPEKVMEFYDELEAALRSAMDI